MAWQEGFIWNSLPKQEESTLVSPLGELGGVAGGWGHPFLMPRSHNPNGSATCFQWGLGTRGSIPVAWLAAWLCASGGLCFRDLCGHCW